MAYDNAAYKLRGDSAKLNFKHIRHDGSDIGNYKPLHSSVDAKLEAICQGLKQTSSGKPIVVSDHSKKLMS